MISIVHPLVVILIAGETAYIISKNVRAHVFGWGIVKISQRRFGRQNALVSCPYENCSFCVFVNVVESFDKHTYQNRRNMSLKQTSNA